MANPGKEYLVFQMHEQKLDWFILREGVYENIKTATTGVLCSETFPGLWLLATAFWGDDLTTMLTILQDGFKSAEHTAFVEQLAGIASGQ